MAIKVTKQDEVIEVKNLCVTIYSQPGLGKTSLAFTSEKPLLIDFDKGAHRAHGRKDVVQIESWPDIAGITRDDVKGYSTVVIDTAGKALDCLAQDVIKQNSKHAYGGALNQQGWGQLGVRFGSFLRMLRGYGVDVILLAHMDEQKDGDAIKERLKIQGGSKDIIMTDSDVIGRISIFNKERHLVLSPTEASFGKDPANMDQMQIPNISDDEFGTCAADMIAAIKGKLNELSEGQIALRAELEFFEVNLPLVFKAEELNKLLGRAKKAGCAAMIVQRAKVLGFEFDPEVKGYVELPTEDGSEDDEGDGPTEDEDAPVDLGENEIKEL